MDLFLFPSETDTFGLVVLEAMASGVPVVAFAPKPMISHGQDGCVVSTAQEFADAVNELIAEPELRRRLSLAAREAAFKESWDAVFSSLYSGYISLLSPTAACERASEGHG